MVAWSRARSWWWLVRRAPGGLACPTHILFNGGVLNADVATARDVATLSRGLTSATTAQTGNGSENLVAKLSASLSAGSLQGALYHLSGYLVQHGQASGGLINTVA